MATLEEIAAKSTATLTAGERDKLREILEFQAETGDALYTDLETKVDALAAVGNQRARAYIDDWDQINVAPTSLAGGTDGVSYSTASHQMEVRNKLRLLLGYEKAGGRRAGGLGRISVGSGSCWYDDVVANS